MTGPAGVPRRSPAGAADDGEDLTGIDGLEPRRGGRTYPASASGGRRAAPARTDGDAGAGRGRRQAAHEAPGGRDGAPRRGGPSHAREEPGPAGAAQSSREQASREQAREQAGGTQPDTTRFDPGSGDTPVARRTSTGWRVGDEEVPDLTSAMVLADLIAAELPTSTFPAVTTAQEAGPARTVARHAAPASPDELDPLQLQQTVAQLERALTARIRVEQAIGVLAERHRLRPRQAFELLRSAARARGRRVLEIATEVVDSASNPLLRIPEELAKPSAVRRRSRVTQHPLES